MHRSVVAAAVVALALAGCERPGDRDPASTRAFAARVLRHTLAYPQSNLVSMSAGQDAAEAVFTTAAPLASVVGWYRQMLVMNGWELQSDAAEKDGGITIYAEKEKRPLWVRLKAGEGGSGTTYTLIGALVEADSAKGTTPAR